MRIHIDYRPGNLDERIARLVREAPERLRQLLHEIVDIVEPVARGNAPIGPTGNYWRGIGSKVTEGEAVIGSRSPHAHLVERGRTPGKMPPPAKIAAILDVSRQEAWPIARAIGRRGTDGFDVFDQARQQCADDVRRAVEDAARDLGGLSRGR